MNITRLAVREIRHRRANFLLSAFSVLVAVATVVLAFTVLARYEYQTRCELWKLNDDYRKITKTLGFNVIIVPKDQKLEDFYADDVSTEYMPESYVTKLAGMSVMTINHCPTLISLEKEGTGREKLICQEMEPKVMSIMAHFFNPEIKVTGLKLPPRTSYSDCCCQWEYTLDR